MAYEYDEEEEEEDEGNEEGDEEKDEDEAEDPEVVLARVERAFRTERARIRASEDVQELRALRSEFQTLESNGRMPQSARIRAHDLVELIDDRITDIKAMRLADRRT